MFKLLETIKQDVGGIVEPINDISNGFNDFFNGFQPTDAKEEETITTRWFVTSEGNFIESFLQ